jgi:peptidyl-prolyl cis-trans isomerase D
MTMLDGMRRHKGWLKWSLALVVLTFVVFFIPNFTTSGASSNEVLAKVEGQEITVRQFQQRYSAQLQAYRNAYGAQVNEQLLRQLGIEQQIVQQLVDEEAMVAEAHRQGLSASDAEIRERILAIPAFQENGHFIGEARYRQLLQFNNPPMTTAEFEDNLRRGVLVEKLRTAVTGWMSVSDAEAAQEYRRRNEKVKLDVVPVAPDAFKSQVSVSDADLTGFFDKRKESYRIAEKRKLRYAIVDVEEIRKQITVPEADIEAFYKQNNAQYSTPEQIRASHILFKTDGKDEAAVKAQAEGVLKRVKAGEDFAALAKQYSEDDSNKDKGGDLDYFGRGTMVPEFDTAAFAMKAGDISDLVKTSFGFHIIKLVDHRLATTKPLAEMRTEIEDQLKWQKAQQEAEKAAKSNEASMKTPADLDRIAKERNYHVQDTGLLLREDPIDGLGPSPEVSTQAFQLADNAVSPALRVSRGWVYVTVLQKQPPYVPQLAEVRDKVRDDLVRERAAEIAKTKAGEIAAALKSAPDFAAAVKKAGLEVKTTELITRGSAIPEFGVSADVDKVAFTLPKGGISDPISMAQGTAIVRVVDKEAVTDDQVKTGIETTRAELVNQRRDRFFGAYMAKAKEKLKVDIRQDTLARAISPTAR